MNLVFLGTAEFAVPGLEALKRAGHTVSLVVTRPDRTAGRGLKSRPSPVKQAAERLRLPVFQPEDVNEPSAVARLAEASPEVGVVIAYGRFLGAELLTVPRHGFVNLHSSLLPEFRGAAPVARALMAGRAETGVSVIRLVRRMDAGPVLSRKAVAVLPEERTGDLEDRLSLVGAELLVEVVSQVAAGTVREEPQDEAVATLAPALRKEEGRVDWNWSAARVWALCRGVHPWPGAQTSLDRGEGDALNVILHRVRLAERADEGTGANGGPNVGICAPGEILAVGERVLVACGEGVLEVLEIQPAGKRTMSAAEFVRGYRLKAGRRFV